jgi:hypothetical protein
MGMESTKFNQIINQRIKMVRRGHSKYNPGEPREDSLVPELIPVPTMCNDCGRTVTGLEQKIYVFKFGTPRQEWRKKCTTCKEFVPLNKPNILK